LEILFSIGYRSGLQKRVDKSVQLAIDEWKREKESKKKQGQKAE
jgi:hypothetical protein